jgi:hypothetical protein
MSTKFAALVQEKKLNTNRLLAVSSELEKLRPTDRSIKLKKRQVKAKVAAGGDVDKNAPPPAKPRTGRPITPRAIAAALAGKPLTGPQKTRLLKAVNALLEKKKQAPVELSALF